MIYQKSIVFNELSVSFINEEQKIIVLENFYHLCLNLIKLSGQCLDNPQKSNFQEILFYENFDRSSIYPKNGSFQDVERIRLKKMFIEREMPSVPQYECEGKECRGLGYAHEQNILSISLETNEKWKKRNLQIDKIENDEKLTTSQVDVKNNIANLDNVFEILEQFADKFYEHCYSERPKFIPSSEEYKNDFEHTLLPLKDISNLYLEHKKFYTQTEEFNEKTKETEIYTTCSTKDITKIKEVAYIIASLNGYTYKEKCSDINKRDVYSHNQHNYFITVDTAECEFEIHNRERENNHKGAFSFDCKRQKGKKRNRKITPC